MCSVFGRDGEKDKSQGTKHSPANPLDRATNIGLLLPIITTEDLHTDLALLNGSLTFSAPLKAAHPPAWFITGLEGTTMKNKPHKYPGYYLCKSEDIRSEQPQAKTGPGTQK